jgi:hypothetical protein
METKIEEILGYNNAKSPSAETIRRAFFVRAEDENTARDEFQAFAQKLPVPEDMELGDIELNEDKNVQNLFFATITFRTPEPRIKRQLADDLFELIGDRRASNRTGDTYERHFRIKSGSALDAHHRLESYIRGAALTVGRMHLDEIHVDEATDSDGFYVGRVTYANPDTFGFSDKIDGIVPAYGTRHSATKSSIETEEVFQLRGYDNADAAMNAMLEVWGNAYGVAGIDLDENAEGTEKLYTGRVRYAKERPDTVEQIGFEVSCTQAHITNSIRTRGGWGPAARNYGGLIGVTSDGVEGVDIDVAVGTFTLTRFFPPAVVTPAFVRYLTAMCGRVNHSAWKGYESGEVRFVGATGGFRRNAQACEITYKFATSPNVYDIQIGDIHVPFKFGWDYLWVRHADVFEDGITLKKPTAVYVEQVYYDVDMESLGAG